MDHIADNDTFAAIAAYLERLGVEGLRQPHDPDAINKSAILRYLVAEKYQEALDNSPSAPGQVKRHGQTPQRKTVLPEATPRKSRS